MGAWCRCGKSIKQSACDDEDTSIIQRKASSSSISTLSLLESRTDGNDIPAKKPTKCQTCLNAEARNHQHHMLARDNADLDFRPPDEILVDRRELPLGSQKNAIQTWNDSIHVVDMPHVHDSQKTAVMYIDSSATPETRIDFQRETWTPYTDAATTNRFFPIADPNRFVPSTVVDSFDQNLAERLASIDTAPSDTMWLMAVMDIDPAPSDERACVEPLEVTEGSLDENPLLQQAVHETAQIPHAIVYDLLLSPSDEDSLQPTSSPRSGIHIDRRLVDEINTWAGLTSSENVNSPPRRLHEQARTFDLLRDEELNNVDSAAATAECIAHDPSCPQKVNPANDQVHDLSTCEETAIKVDVLTSAGVEGSPASIKGGLDGENQVIDQGDYLLNPFSCLCAL